MNNYNYKDYREVIDVVKKDSSELVEKMFANYPSNDVPNNTEYVQVLEDVREIVRGTTGTHTFVVDKSLLLYDDIQITYTQNTGHIVVKNKDEVFTDPDVSEDSGKLIVNLSQEETLRFNAHSFAFVQVKIKKGDNILMTRPYKIIVYECTNDTTL